MNAPSLSKEFFDSVSPYNYPEYMAGLKTSDLTPEQRERADIARLVDGSFALEGIKPTHIRGGYPAELQRLWIMGEITDEEEETMLLDHFSEYLPHYRASKKLKNSG